MIGRILCDSTFGVSCNAPDAKENSHALTASCPPTSVELQYQHSLGSAEITSPPHLLFADITIDCIA